MKLRRYWFEFDPQDRTVPVAVRFGCGVTAWTKDDAVGLLRSCVFSEQGVPASVIREDVDVSTLDANHVLPNMAPPSVRGIWFPLGYQENST